MRYDSRASFYEKETNHKIKFVDESFDEVSSPELGRRSEMSKNRSEKSDLKHPKETCLLRNDITIIKILNEMDQTY